MKLLDTNILIYSGEQDFTGILHPFVTDPDNLVSVISQVETLGFSRITPQQVIYFESLFLILETVPVDDRIIQKAIELRQGKKMSLGDSLIAASAIVREAMLITRNYEDFQGIPGLSLVNPLD